VKSNSRSDKQFCYRQISPDTRNKGEKKHSFTTQRQYVWASAAAENMRALQDKPILQARTLTEGEQQHPRRQQHLRQSPTEPRTATRSEVLCSEERHQHRARAIAARVSSRNLARSLSQLPPEDISLAHGLRNSTPAPVPPVDGPVRLRPTKSSFRANSASVHTDTAASGFGSSKSGREFL
jgi:hypothetical protein